jgi:SET domain-containing protein
MTSHKLLRDIAATRIGLATSPVHGIGVFALTEIPAGTMDLFSPPGEDWPAVPLGEVEALPAHARQLIDTYCLQDDTHAYLPPRGFRVLDLVIYLNHSATPNLKQINGGDYFVTLRDIATGEELLVDYEQLDVN